MHNPLNVAHIRNEANASFSVRKILQRLRIKCMGQVDRVFVRVSIHGRTMRQRQCAVHATLLAPRDSKMELWNERILAGTGVLCAPQCRHFVWGLISVYYTQSAPLYDAAQCWRYTMYEHIFLFAYKPFFGMCWPKFQRKFFCSKMFEITFT